MKRSRGEINGFLDRTTSVEGELRFKDTMRIDGRVSGRIISDNELIVGETAVINADIDVAAILILGRVSGRLRATSRVELHAGAELRGDVSTPSLRIEEGAVFQGQCDMGLADTKVAGTKPDERATRLALVDAMRSGS